MSFEDLTKAQMLAELTELREKIASFDSKLRHFGEEDSSLRKIFGELEQLLGQRTTQLVDTSTKLELEIEERGQAETRLSAELDKFQALYELAVAMTAERTLDQNLSLVVDTSRRLLAADTSYIALRDEAAGELYMYTLSGIRTEAFKKMRMPFGVGLGGEVAKTCKAVIVKDYFQEITPIVHDIVREEGVISGIAVPLQISNRNLGVLYVFNRGRTSFTKSDVDTLSLLGNLAAVEITRAKAQAALRESQDELEKRIAQRTTELVKANEELKREIARRQRIQEALEESEKRYRLLFESAGDAIYVLEADGEDAGKIVSANHVAAEMHGYTLSELLSMSIADLDTPESSEQTSERFSTVLAGETMREEVTHRKKDGTVFPVEISARLFGFGGQKYSLAIDRDITQRRLAENALKSSEERMRLLIELSPIGIRVARGGNYVYANPEFVRMFGYNGPAEIVGLPVASLYAPGDRELVRRLRSGGSGAVRVPSYYEVKGMKKNGDVFDVAVWVATIDYEGALATLGFVVDSSKEKSLRDQLLRAQRMESLGTLAGGIAHDFNNILTIILGFADMLTMCGYKEEKCFQRVKSIRSAALRGSELVRQILTFSRKTEPKLRPTDLNHELRQAENLLHRTIPKMISIELSLEDDLRAINGDPAQIEQVLLNLSVNAKQAMPDGGKLLFQTENVTLNEEYFRTSLEVESSEYVLLKVSDTGQGMERQVLDRIFEPFFTTKELGEGTGLGLSTVFGIVKSHGGHITCQSEPGEGTTFNVYFPAISRRCESKAETTVDLPRGGAETLLLVDDEDAIRELGKEFLNQMGYSVLAAKSGQEALDIYHDKGESISAVILDLIMPDMSGRQCMEEILKLDPNARVILSTGYSSGSMLKDLMSSARGFIAKPYDVKKLLQTVRNVLDEG